MLQRPANILITRILPEIATRLLAEAGMRITQWDQSRDMTAEEFRTAAAQHDAVLTIGANRVDREFLEACPDLKMISQFAVGYDNIDVAEATKRGIPVGNTPDSVTHATADVAFLLMMAVSRKAFFLNRQISLGNWKQFEPVKDLGIELRGKTLGIFGMGRIGVQLALRCKGAFGMEVIYHNRTRNPDGERQTGATWVPFDRLLESSDVLSVHSVLSSETRNRFSREEFSRMKPGSIFINTSRGGVHDEEALIDALQRRIIWGAGLDVTNPEPMHPDNPLLTMENVAILPHIGSGTEETRSDMARTAAENLISFFRNGTVPHCVNPDVLNR
ncbi:MAG: 2-hydroxyacid dehydrogenase [Bacteroidota bacterium]